MIVLRPAPPHSRLAGMLIERGAVSAAARSDGIPPAPSRKKREPESKRFLHLLFFASDIVRKLLITCRKLEWQAPAIARSFASPLGITNLLKQAMKPKGLIACIAQTTSPVGHIDKYLSNFLRSLHCRSAHSNLTPFRLDIINR
jgi:hypothetical protein